MHFRWLSTRLPQSSERRVTVLTGPRQVGKTTLAKRTYPDVRYVNLDAPEDRAQLRAVRTAAWARTIGAAVLDEAQKEPSLFEKVKYAYDAGELDFTVLLGSSRLLVLDRVRETLAGRAFVFEMMPLMFSELIADEGTTPPLPLLDRLLTSSGPVGRVLDREPQVLLGEEAARLAQALEYLTRHGGMPELLALTETDRRTWLHSYARTYVERDVMDLSRLADLEPFRLLQRLAMLRSAQLLSFAELSRDAGIGASTARRYLDYLDLTYQTVRLAPFHRNLTSAAVKTPKLYWGDVGILREGTGQWDAPVQGAMAGALFETLIVTEAHKWIATMQRDTRLSFYRTRAGLEVDLMLETPTGVIGVEVKNRSTVRGSDARALTAVALALGTEWRGGIVVTRGESIEPLDETLDLWAVPAERLLS